MKKFLSVFLAALMTACLFTPVLAAGGTYNVTYTAPSAQVGEGAYVYYESQNGAFTRFVEDPDGGYGYYSVEGKYYYLDDLTTESRKVFDNAAPGTPESVRYSPAKCENGPVTAGKTVSFLVETNEVYDVSTVVVLCNGEVLPKNASGEYAVRVDRDLVFSVLERDENNAEILQKNKFVVSLTSGDGYAAKPYNILPDQTVDTNNKAVEYGGDFSFRVKITKGFNGDNMKVKVIRGENFLSEFLGEDADLLGSVMGDAETLASIGVDRDGYRIYKITNITTNCKVQISGVNQDSSKGILAMFKRILRLLLGLLGINLDSLLGEENNPLAAYTVTLSNSLSADGLSVTTNPEFSYNPDSGNIETEVLNGECVSIVITSTRENPNVTVRWYPTDDPSDKSGEDYIVHWQSVYDLKTQKTTWSAIWYIDGINKNTTIEIS